MVQLNLWRCILILSNVSIKTPRGVAIKHTYIKHTIEIKNNQTWGGHIGKFHISQAVRWTVISLLLFWQITYQLSNWCNEILQRTIISSFFICLIDAKVKVRHNVAWSAWLHTFKYSLTAHETLKKQHKIHKFLERIIACDEKWIWCKNAMYMSSWIKWHQLSQNIPKPYPSWWNIRWQLTVMSFFSRLI